ncbi:MAG: oxygenase MpaB family protein [Aquabacterium sp.]
MPDVPMTPSAFASPAADKPQAPPLRHGADVSITRRVARNLRWSIRGECEPTGAQWDALGATLWRGDPLADEVVDWLHVEGMNTARPKLERAIEHGLAAVPDAPPALRRFIETTEQAPAWLDRALMYQGARFIHSTGQHGMLVLRDAGLMAGYQAAAINQTLLMTGALKRGAQRRVAETTSWWIDCTTQGGMEREAKGFKTTLRVRVMHAIVRRNVSQRPQWDAVSLGLPINQVDMQATYLGFSVVHLLALKSTGVLVTDDDARAMMHLWRYIGWLMGVEDGLLYDDEMQARIGLYHNILSQAPPDESSAALGQALMDEPLHRHYPWGGALRGRFNKARHLSVARLFVGSEGMRHLGLPPTLPWYPVLTFVPRLLWTSAHRVLPGGKERLQTMGRRSQLAYLPIMFGERQHGVAEMAAADHR